AHKPSKEDVGACRFLAPVAAADPRERVRAKRGQPLVRAHGRHIRLYLFSQSICERRPSRRSDRFGRDLTFEIGPRTDGTEEWHQLYGVPSWGFGFSLGSFSNDVVHAQPTEAYTFFSWPFARFTDRLDMATEFGMGMSWHWKEVADDATEHETSLGSN